MILSGDIVLVRYRVGGAALWHERIVLCEDRNNIGHYAILTPDFDVYVESLAVCDDVRGSIKIARLGERPAAVGRQAIYAFYDPLPSLDAMARYVGDGCHQAGVAVSDFPRHVIRSDGTPLYVGSVDPHAARNGGVLALPGSIIGPSTWVMGFRRTNGRP